MKQRTILHTTAVKSLAPYAEQMRRELDAFSVLMMGIESQLNAEYENAAPINNALQVFYDHMSATVAELEAAAGV